jgi:hypothetical protein
MVNIKSHFKDAKQRVNAADSAENVYTEALDFLTENATKINRQQTDQFLSAVEEKLVSFRPLPVARYEMFLNSVSSLSYHLVELAAERREKLAHAKEAAPIMARNAEILATVIGAQPK